MSYLPRFSPSSSDLIGTFKAELARTGAVTGLADSVSALWPRFAACYQGLARLPRKARRALQRRWRRSLAGIALLYALGHVPTALAAQIDVGVGGCTLVNAITAANADQPTGGCSAGIGADTITLPAGSTQFSPRAAPSALSGRPAYRSSPPRLSSTAKAAPSCDPQVPEFRILAVDAAGSLVLQETTVTGGVISTFSGGGIFNFGTLTLTDSTVSGNSAFYDGGGVSNDGTLTLTNSTVSGNSAGVGVGGGMLNLSSGTLTLTSMRPRRIAADNRSLTPCPTVKPWLP